MYDALRLTNRDSGQTRKKPVLRTGPSPTTTCPWLEAWSAMPGPMPGDAAVRSTEPCLFPPGQPDRSMRAFRPV